MIVYCLESICFFGAVWFFSMNYYDNASELKIVLSESPRTSKMLEKRKKRFKICRWLVFIILIASEVFQGVAASTSLTRFMGMIMFGVGFITSLGIIIAVATLIVMAIYNLISIVSMIPGLKEDFNLVPIVFQIVGLVLWTGIWTAEQVINLRYFRKQSYAVYRDVIIIDTISFVMNLDIFIIIAYVLY